MGKKREKGREGGRNQERKKEEKEKEGGIILMLAMTRCSMQYIVCDMTCKCVHMHSHTSSWSLLGSSSLRLFSARAGDSGQVAARGLFSGTPYVNSQNSKPGSTSLVSRAGNFCRLMHHCHCTHTWGDSLG